MNLHPRIRNLPWIPLGLLVVLLKHFWEWWHFGPSQWLLRKSGDFYRWHIKRMRSYWVDYETRKHGRVQKP